MTSDGAKEGKVGYLILLAVAVAAGGAAYYWGGALIKDNDDVLDVIVTLFSILAGFIIAIMTLLGDESLRAGGWRRARVDADKVRRRLDRQQQLFWLYLVTLSLIVASKLVAGPLVDVSHQLERAAFGFAVTALILSYALPIALRSAQLARIEDAVEEKRSKSGILDQN
jgi:hypothetical protein